MKGTVLFTKKNTLGIYGFIKDEKGDSFYFDTSYIVKGDLIRMHAISLPMPSQLLSQKQFFLKV